MTIRVENSIWINRNVEEVFAFMTNAGNLPKYVPGVVAAERNGPEDPGVGSRIVCKMSTLGANFDITAEWTRYEPGVALASQNVEGMKSDMLCTFHAENGGTRVERVLVIEPKGFFGTLAKPIIKRSTVRNAETEFATLKDMLEGQ